MEIKNINILYKNKFVFGNLYINKDKISDIKILGKEDPNSDYLLPGLIDVHTHGAMNYDFNSINSKENIKSICDFYEKHGVTSVLATVMTDSYENLINKVSLINKYIKEFPIIKGIHLEGPFLSSKYRGAHEEKYLRKPNIELFKKLQDASGHNIKYITIAPELPLTFEFIDYLTNDGVIVSIGHSAATYEEAREAINIGASSFTHTFNAMAPFNHHNLTITYAALSILDVYNEIILDGKHVDPEIVRFLVKNKGIKNIVGITDSLMCTGLPNGKYKLANQDIEVKDGDCFILGTAIRAGSSLNAFDGLLNFMYFLDMPLEEAIDVYTKNPAKHINLFNEIGSIRKNKMADLIVINNKRKIKKVFINGNEVYINECNN